jgi:hypothetical protein
MKLRLESYQKFLIFYRERLLPFKEYNRVDKDNCPDIILLSG